MSYQDNLQSEDWLTKRYLKRLKANRCGICGSTARLDVHHLNYRNLYDVEISDLRVLCRRCHFLAHELHRKGILIFTSTNHHSRFSLTKTAVKRALGLTHENLFYPRVP